MQPNARPRDHDSADLSPELRLCVANRLDELGRVIGEFSAFAACHDLDDETRRAMSMTLDELINNSVLHGASRVSRPSENRVDQAIDQPIDLRIQLKEDRLTATIEDSGVPFDPSVHEAPDTTGSLEERQVGGLGIHLIKNVMDEVSYVRRAGRNVVTVVKRLPNTDPRNEETPR